MSVTEYPFIRCKASDLQLADTIRLFEGAFGTGVVNQIKDGLVTVFRPYATTADFSYTGGVIPLIGIESVTLMVSSDVVYEVYSRKELK